MRKIKTRDIAPAGRLLASINVDKLMKDIDEIKKVVKDEEELGFKVFMLFLVTYGQNKAAEKALVEFLSGPFEMDADSILDLDIDEMWQMIKEAGGIGAFINFFGNVRH